MSSHCKAQTGAQLTCQASLACLCYYNKMLETGFFIIKKETYSLEVLGTGKSKTKTGLWHLMRDRPKNVLCPHMAEQRGLTCSPGPFYKSCIPFIWWLRAIA